MKKVRRALKLCLLLFTVMATTHVGYTQESLKDQYEQIMQKSSTYEQYKVIRQTEIEGFWVNIADTLSSKSDEISSLQSRITDLQTNIDSLKSDLRKVNVRLAESIKTNDVITFLGMEMEKTAYHILVWVIILILAVAVVLAYGMFMKSNASTSRIKREFEQQRKEFETHRDKSRETQVRLKRELQTAVNTIEEMKRGGARR
ncbi:hypothetical protein [Marinoscillum luteum]|uniref:tRNA (Guanine-N1)-methyltransferase n=1 Tax=Marinoscillum luteum TaxID=861051 RepID=A0ABW7N3W5_9BACT